MNLRSRFQSIRLQMLAIVLIPSAALLVIGVGAAGYLVNQGYRAQNWATTMQETVAPGTNFTAQVEQERQLSLLQLAGEPGVGAALKQQRSQLDTTMAGLQSLAADLIKLNPAALQQGNAAFAQLLGQLPVTRQGVDNGKATVPAVYAYYNQLTSVIKVSLQGLAKTAPDPVTAVEESNAVQLFDVADGMSRAHALALAGTLGGGMTADELQEFASQVGLYRSTLDSLVPTLNTSVQNLYHQLQATPAWQQLTQVESTLVVRGVRPSTASAAAELPVSIAQWQDAVTKVNTQLLNMYSQQHTYAEGFAAQAGHTTFVNSLVGGAIVLLATLLAAFVAIRLSTRVVNRLKRLRVETLELSETRLPRMVERLRGGEKIDIAREVPPLNYGKDELGQVAEAFNRAQRTAVAAAAQEADIQNGVKAVFLNIAHRSQVVVRRQLEVLDRAERNQEDPEQLEALFQLDNLATRARRNAENLIILGGERPGRQWRNPVQLVEIVRSAIGETENYRRVNTGRLPELSISGAVVADLIHLLAELVENATAFSPPDARVEVRGNMVGKGVVVEVEDQGLGISRAEREGINSYLQNPPDFGVMALSEEARLGLFVVAQLAARHGISVTLVDSAYGGVRAIVLIRTALLAAAPSDNSQDGGAPSVPPQRAVLPGARHDAVPPGTRSAARPHRAPAEPERLAPAWPEPRNGNHAAPPAMRTAPAPNPAAEDQAQSTGDGRPELPRRRRQASLAPQLAAETEEIPTRAVPTAPTDQDAADSAQRARNRMAALQRGTRQGRTTPV